MNKRVIKIDSNDTTRSVQSNMILIYVETLKGIAEQDSAPLDIKNDWKIITKWLGTSSGLLNPKQEEMLQKAWLSYLARGKSPDNKLKEAFSFYNETSIDEKWGSMDVPQEIVGVFDRMLSLSTGKPSTPLNKAMLPILTYTMNSLRLITLGTLPFLLFFFTVDGTPVKAFSFIGKHPIMFSAMTLSASLVTLFIAYACIFPLFEWIRGKK